MSNYRRIHQPGGCWFFTVVTYQRQPWFKDLPNIQVLREALAQVRRKRAFAIDAMVVLPDHLHCVLRLPEGDSDFSGRWREIKKYVTNSLDVRRNHRGEGMVWQRRFWEHLIRDEDDWRRHMDYVHYNPVKHGYVNSPAQWRWSSFHRAVQQGMYEASWGRSEPDSIFGMQHE